MYEDKDTTYFSNIRDDLINLIPHSFTKCNVLEVGCGSAATLHKLKQLGIADTTTGVELFPSENNYYDTVNHFFSEDIEKMFFQEYLHGSFDIIILGDVLEHLVNPWSTLKKISHLLAPEGKIIASLPNIRNYSVLKSIIWNGSFDYQETGILDKTHVRFFCKKNIQNLFLENDLKIQHISNNLNRSKSKRALFNTLTLKIFEEFLVTQYHVVAIKAGV